MKQTKQERTAAALIERFGVRDIASALSAMAREDDRRLAQAQAAAAKNGCRVRGADFVHPKFGIFVGMAAQVGRAR